MILSIKKVFPEDSNILKTFKWMYCPLNNIVLVSGEQFHSSIYNHWLKTTDEPVPFEKWIRFIHLSPQDFKIKRKKKLLCIRQYPIGLAEKSDVKELIRSVGIKSNTRFDITNEKLADITHDYLRKW